MKVLTEFLVVSCLVLAIIAKPQGYAYEKPSNDGLSVALLIPSTVNQQHTPTSFPALSHFASSQSQKLAPIGSHGSLGLGSHSSGGSLSLGSSYAVSQGPTINTFGGHSHGTGLSNSHSFGSGSSYAVSQGPTINTFGGHSHGTGLSNSHSFGSGSSYAASQGPTINTFDGHLHGTGLSSSHSFGSGSSNSFGSASGLSRATAQAPVAPSNFIQTAPNFASAPAAPSFVSAPATSTLIQKHIYVHVPPPEEEEELRAPLQPSVVNKQKHYKIIFIKAPSASSVSQQLAQAQIAQQQTEEKTLVYVLVKKQESLEDLQHTIARAPLPQPSKPEVYFIKYKAQTDELPSPAPIAQPISISPDVSGQTADFQLSQSASNVPATSISSASSVAAVDISSHATSALAIDTASSVESGQNVGNIASVIQPRNPDDDGHVPATEYGLPN